MPESMSISVNGQSQVPPGFRFHPTEEELLHYYLRKKVSSEKIDLDVIRDVDLNKLEPWDIQEKCKIGSTPQSDWYFFSHKDKKYPTGTRTNRATAAGFWKATGRDKVIHSNCRRIGMRKTLVFYKGRAPHGQKSDWIMHEYRLDDNPNEITNVSNVMGEGTQEESWVVCRIFKKKDHHKTLGSPTSSSINGNRMFNSCNEGSLEQILQHMGGTCKEESDEANNNLRLYRAILGTGTGGFDHNDPFLKLPSLKSPNSTGSQNNYHHYPMPIVTENEGSVSNQVRSSSNLNNSVFHTETESSSGLTSWAALDRLVASQLNGQTETSRQLACFNEPTMAPYCNPTDDDDHPHDFQLPTLRSSSILTSNSSYHGSEDYNNNEIDLWSYTRSSSSSDPLCHASNNRL